MSEGELKKRIRELAGYYKGIYFNKIDRENLEKILDEAKQDFPLGAYFTEKYFLPLEYRYTVRTASQIKLQEWFEKWFGSAEK